MLVFLHHLIHLSFGFLGLEVRHEHLGQHVLMVHSSMDIDNIACLVCHLDVMLSVQCEGQGEIQDVGVYGEGDGLGKVTTDNCSTGNAKAIQQRWKSYLQLDFMAASLITFVANALR